MTMWSKIREQDKVDEFILTQICGVTSFKNFVQFFDSKYSFFSLSLSILTTTKSSFRKQNKFAKIWHFKENTFRSMERNNNDVTVFRSSEQIYALQTQIVFPDWRRSRENHRLFLFNFSQKRTIDRLILEQKCLFYCSKLIYYFCVRMQVSVCLARVTWLLWR